MPLRSLSLRNYRNFGSLDISLEEGITIVEGENGKGKTNLLEAIYFLTTSKSPLTHRDADLIKWGEDYLRAFGDFGELGIEISMRRGKPLKKRIRINGVERDAKRLVESVSSVLFHPRDLEILEEPSQRRKYINLVLSRINPKYFPSLRLYYRLLYHRNRLIKRMAGGEKAEDLEIWDERLSREGDFITEERERLILRISPILEEIFSKFSGKRGSLVYMRTTEGGMRESLRRNLERDRRYLATTTGPHRDDLLFLIDGRREASRGERRLFILSLKLAEAIILKEEGKEPILLLDDIFSELDPARRETLSRNLPPLRQTVITTADLSPIPSALRENSFRVRL